MGARAVVVIGALAIMSVSACSLLVSTSGYDNPAPSTPVDGGDAATQDSGSGGVADAGDDGGDADGASSGDQHLIGAWSFDDAVGNVAADSTGHNHPGTLSGSAKLTSSASSACVKGGCLELDGADGAFVKMASLETVSFPQVGTLSIHFKYTAPQAPDTFMGVFDGWDNTRQHFFLRHPNGTPPSRFQFAAQQVDTKYAFEDSFDLAINTWMHAVFTWNVPEQTTAIFLNGELHLTGGFATDLPDFAPKQQNFALGYYFKGMIDEVRLYDVVLAKDAIKALE